eukprot:255042-Prorocentrum_lima.AAC.1
MDRREEMLRTGPDDIMETKYGRVVHLNIRLGFETTLSQAFNVKAPSTRRDDLQGRLKRALWGFGGAGIGA